MHASIGLRVVALTEPLLQCSPEVVVVVVVVVVSNNLSKQ